MLAIIVPGTTQGGEPTPNCMGTRVEVAPGVALNGVTSINLRAEVGGLWTADVQCLVHVQPIHARVRLRLPKPARYYRRAGRAIWR